MTGDWNTYVINLDRSHDRWQSVCEQARRISLPINRIPATDGINGVDLDAIVDQQTFHRLHHALLRPPEVGCYHSHLRTLQTFLDTGASYCLILEDDVLFTDILPAALHDLAHWQDHWDIVKLNWRHPAGGITRAASPDGRLISITFRTSGSGAYAVTRHAAQVLLEHLVPMRFPYDWAFDRVWDTGLRLRGYDPMPILQAPVRSLITSSPPLDPTQPSIRGMKLHKPWHQQTVTFSYRLWCEYRRLHHALLTDGGIAAFLQPSPLMHPPHSSPRPTPLHNHVPHSTDA